MEEKPVLIAPALYLRFAGSDIGRWKLLVDQHIEHSVLGYGVVVDVKGDSNGVILFITFEQDGLHPQPRKFPPQALEKCKYLALPQLLADQVRQLQPSSKGGLILNAPKPITKTNVETDPPKRKFDAQPITDPTSQKSQGAKLKPDIEFSDRSKPMFNLGEVVLVRNNPGLRGVICAKPFFSQDVWQYEVFISASQKSIYREKDLDTPGSDLQWGRLNDLLRNLALVKLRKPLTDNLYALYGSRTQFEVYQFKPALKFLSNPDQRMLIADEVGLGKTIEAGIIFLEMQARLEMNRVLIVCPSGLKVKWQDEMKLRFDEEFDILDMQKVRRFLQQYQQFGERMRLRGIVSLELLRRPELAEAIESQRINFDLVVIDEAHHCRNSGTLNHDIATVLSDNADAMLLLTATPLQMGNQDLFNLLRILSPGEFDDFEAFIERLEPNQFINRAAQILATGDHRQALKELRKVERTPEKQRFIGNPYYAEISRLLGQNHLIRMELVAAQRRLIELNTLASIFTRTRKREIDAKVPTRAAFNLVVRFTPAEQRFYSLVIQHVRDEFRMLHGSSFASGWVSIMRERQTASCISAARKRFAELAKQAAFSTEEDSFMDHSVMGEWRADEQDNGKSGGLNRFLKAIRGSAEPAVDSKFGIFLETIQKVHSEDQTSKIIIFSFFRATIEYLYTQLNEIGFGVLQLHGGFKVTDRQRIIDQFRSDPKIRILVSSDVGAEGLDFQFCNTIFNYDLPWNPMKVEQRIGRIDRFGQQSAKIRIYNLVLENSIESRILMRLYDRIGIFKQSIGDIEAILGEEVRELSKRVYTSQLSPEEEVRLTDQAASNILRRQQEMEEFEEKRLQFMGQEAIFSTLVNQTIESGSYISELEVRGLVETFILEAFEHSRLEWDDGGDSTAALEVNDDLANHLRGFIEKQRRNDQTAQEFLKILVVGKCIPLTFSSKLAYERKLLEFITFRHPLSLAAAAYWKERIDPARPVVYFGLQSDGIREGEFFFFVFTLDSLGAERNTRLVSVAVTPDEYDVYTDLSNKFLRLVQTSAVNINGTFPRIDQEDLARAEEVAKTYMALRRDEIEAEIKRSNDALVNARISALTQTYEAKRRRVEAALENAVEVRIRRMREAQLKNLEARYLTSRQETESQSEISVSFSMALRGIVKVV